MGLWSFWLILGVGFLVVELLTMSMVCIYVGIGALAAMVAAFLGGEWLATTVTFVAVTVLLYLVTYRLRKQLCARLHKESEQAITGMDALIGRTGKVISAPDGFRMKIDGDVWKVTSSEVGYILSEGDEARVTGYDSIVLKVESFKQHK